MARRYVRLRFFNKRLHDSCIASVRRVRRLTASQETLALSGGRYSGKRQKGNVAFRSRPERCLGRSKPLLAQAFRLGYRESCVASQASGDCSCSGAVQRQHSNGFCVRNILCGRWQEKLRSSPSNGVQVFFPPSSHACSTTSGGLSGMPQDRRAVLAAAP
jgi:hypothetical protein